MKLAPMKTFTNEWQLSTKATLFEGYNFHWDFKTCKYINILKHNTITFILLHIQSVSDDYFIKKNAILPSALDDFTKQLLLVENRDDKEILNYII